MALVDMALTKAERKERMPTACSGKDEGPEYPWGLSITLDTETLDKLGLEGLPEPGEYITLVAVCCVTSVSQNKTNDEDDRRSVSLQIEKMRLGGDGDEDDDDKLPGGKKAPAAKTIASMFSRGKDEEN